MLIAALTIFLLGGGSDNLWLFPEKFNDQVKEAVSEKQKQSEIIAIYDEIKKSTDSYNEEIRIMAEEVSLLNRKPNISETDLDQPIQELLQKRKKMQQEIIDARLQMVTHFQRDEWEKVFAQESK
jgi:hypothetical protein